MTKLGQRGAEIHGGGRFAHAAFLVSNRDDFHFWGAHAPSRATFGASPKELQSLVF